MFFKSKKEEKSKYQEGFDSAHFSNSFCKNPYDRFKEPKKHREWFIGYTDGINSMNISMNKNIFNYQIPKCSG